MQTKTLEPSWKANHKTKEEAFIHILECFVQNPACAHAEDKKIHIKLFGTEMVITPKKPKQKDVIHIED